ncbi:MAG: DoxX family protein, partial [Mucilaginibacter sp.]|nr:DoxX family protein [Mucilaginibacter sp.]MDB5288065.1 DoxX family protein [Mucilaginibacter sp.]
MEKRKLIIYWVATSLLAFGMLGSGLAQIFHTKEMVD